jgi:hypothetical protein
MINSERTFKYHAPKAEQVPIYEEIREMGRKFAEAIDGYTGDCREKSLAITKIEEAIFWANAAVAREG